MNRPVTGASIIRERTGGYVLEDNAVAAESTHEVWKDRLGPVQPDGGQFEGAARRVATKAWVVREPVADRSILKDDRADGDANGGVLGDDSRGRLAVVTGDEDRE